MEGDTGGLEEGGARLLETEDTAEEGVTVVLTPQN